MLTGRSIALCWMFVRRQVCVNNIECTPITTATSKPVTTHTTTGKPRTSTTTSSKTPVKQHRKKCKGNKIMRSACKRRRQHAQQNTRGWIYADVTTQGIFITLISMSRWLNNKRVAWALLYFATSSATWIFVKFTADKCLLQLTQLLPLRMIYFTWRFFTFWLPELNHTLHY